MKISTCSHLPGKAVEVSLRRALGLLMLTALSQAVPAAAVPTTSFELSGAVDRPAAYALPELQGLPQRTAAVTFGTGRGPFSASFSGPTLWSVLGSAGLTPVPGARNSSLRNVVVATGSDGYAAAFSGGELDPRFGGGRAPILVGTAQDGQPLGADGFARTVVPGDAIGGRYVRNLAQLDVVQAPLNPSRGGDPSTNFTLSGLVGQSATYDAAALAALPATTESLSFTAAGTPVTANFTGVPLWTLLTTAGLVPDPDARGGTLRLYVLATGSDGYEAAFSVGELDPRFRGSLAPVLVAYAQDGQPLGADGIARLAVPGDAAGGRYVSNLVSLQVLDATEVPGTAVPEPGSLVLLLLGLAGLTSWPTGSIRAKFYGKRDGRNTAAASRETALGPMSSDAFEREQPVALQPGPAMLCCPSRREPCAGRLWRVSAACAGHHPVGAR